MDDKHCVDCCCAKSWKALGVSEYTGKHIAEHIEELKHKADLAQSLADALEELLDFEHPNFDEHHEALANYRKEMQDDQ